MLTSSWLLSGAWRVHGVPSVSAPLPVCSRFNHELGFLWVAECMHIIIIFIWGLERLCRNTHHYLVYRSTHRYLVFVRYMSPWYDFRGWLCVKNQLVKRLKGSSCLLNLFCFNTMVLSKYHSGTVQVKNIINKTAQNQSQILNTI